MGERISSLSPCASSGAAAAGEKALAALAALIFFIAMATATSTASLFRLPEGSTPTLTHSPEM
jgi:hypothetical protein